MWLYEIVNKSFYYEFKRHTLGIVLKALRLNNISLKCIPIKMYNQRTRCKRIKPVLYYIVFELAIACQIPYTVRALKQGLKITLIARKWTRCTTSNTTPSTFKSRSYGTRASCRRQIECRHMPETEIRSLFAGEILIRNGPLIQIWRGDREERRTRSRTLCI